MLHYAEVEDLNIENIIDGKLEFRINGQSYTITWLPEHEAVISKFDEP